MTMRNRPARTPGRRRGRAGSIVLDPCFQAGVTDYRDGRPPVEHGPEQKTCLGCRFKCKGRSAEAHYDTMSIADICATPVGGWAAPDCVLFLWVTDPILERAFEVIRAWDFAFKTIGFCWAKTRATSDQKVLFGPLDEIFSFGMGHWTRGNTELCLLATRGRPRRLNRRIRKLILAKRREHSRKPDDIYFRIERLVAGPFLELFASSNTPHRDGWVRWVGKDRAPERRWPSNSYPGAEAER
jgi:N6-adenosine-specific RNA methylase IME4